MGYLLFDASGLSKRYTEENGKDTVDAVFSSRQDHEFICTAWGYLEIYAVLQRRTNNRQLTPADFAKAIALLQKEVLGIGGFHLLAIDDGTVLGATEKVSAHNLNSVDAALLATFLNFAQVVGTRSCLLVASDKRLLRAALAEGLPCLNPETVPASDVPALLAAL